MILRSTSNPVTGNLISSFSSDSPGWDFDANKNHNHHHLPFQDHKLTPFSPRDLNHLNLTPFSCRSSPPISELNQERSNSRLPRRAMSDGNLDRFAYTSCDAEDLLISTSPEKFADGNRTTMLHTAPSFAIFSTLDGLESDQRKTDTGGEDGGLMRTATIGEKIEAVGSGGFSFGKKRMGLIEEEREKEQERGLNGFENLSINNEEEKEPASPPLYLAAGLGIDGIDFGGGGGRSGDFALPNFDENGDVEEYYKEMIDEYPCHPLFLTNYAQLLQSKGDLQGAEDYFYRATLADPEDGQSLMQYAKLVWELHHDKDTALSIFKRAVHVAPQDSHVLAAYASFLWEIDDDKEEDTAQQEHSQAEEQQGLNLLEQLQLPNRLKMDVAGHAASAADKGEYVEEYHRRLVEENPSNSLVLRNYARFLYEAKGDHQGAEEYYSRAILADPGDGEVVSQYAKLVWELHHDHEKALCYFERAVLASPENSYVLAAYASFLWETDEGEEDTELGQSHGAIYHEGAIIAANS